MNETIASFFQQQTCATICCSDEAGKPYCFSCFYVFNKENGLLYFKTSTEAHHTILLTSNPVIAGTILPDKLNKLATRGIQLQGEVLPHLDPIAKNAYMRYHKKYPMALAIKGEVFTIRVDSIKMTDSKFGFGEKINWKRP